MEHRIVHVPSLIPSPFQRLCSERCMYEEVYGNEQFTLELK